MGVGSPKPAAGTTEEPAAPQQMNSGYNRIEAPRVSPASPASPASPVLNLVSTLQGIIGVATAKPTQVSNVNTQQGQVGTYRYMPPPTQYPTSMLPPGADLYGDPKSAAYVGAQPRSQAQGWGQPPSAPAQSGGVPPWMQGHVGGYQKMLPLTQTPPGGLQQGLDVYGDPNSAAYVSAQPVAPTPGWSQNAFMQGLGSLGNR